MKPILVAITLAAGLIVGPALAQQASDTTTMTDLTQEQLDALTSVLSGLPRQ